MRELIKVKGCVLLLLFFLSCQTTEQKTSKTLEGVNNFLDFVNPLIGSDSEYSLSNGNTYPAIALPWGMNFWTPQTGKMGDGWAYTYKAKAIKGFKQTHQPSPWINDYGAFAIMPITGELKVNELERASTFNHESEISKPHYYKVILDTYNVSVEITPTERAAFFQMTFSEAKEGYVLIDAFNEGSYVKVIPEEQKIIGYAKNNSGGVPENFANYFVIEFDTPFKLSGTWKNDEIQPTLLEVSDEHVGAYVKFDLSLHKVIKARVASSFISQEQAQINLDREIPKDETFESIRNKGAEVWNRELSRIKVEGGTKDDKTKFYSSLYRTLLFPRKFYEYDQNNNIVHYSPYNGQVLPGYLYTDNGFWDTFRAVFPFYSILYPEMLGNMMEGIMVNPYKESGWLPEWSSPGHRNSMIGSNSAVIIAEAYLKGIENFDIQTAYEGILKNTENVGPLSSLGRKGVTYYNTLGYVPYDVGIKENTARTLEYAYADFCIWKLGEKLGKSPEELEIFKKRSNNYKNVFDPSTNFMRGKNKDGSFQSPFRADAWGSAFTEGSSWHYTWSVLHDPLGLADLMGGVDKFAEKLDSVFSSPPTSDYSYYGKKIHEIVEMELGNMGQYAHGNQPIQHGIYLYNWARQPWKTQEKVRYVMDNLYGAGADGYCGDEDNGQTSAWFLFSSMGFYPVAPATKQYIIGSPLFEKITITLSNGKNLVIKSHRNSKENIYIQNATLGVKKLSKNWLSHEEITNGGVLSFEMGNVPNKKWGSEPENVPYSMNSEKFTTDTIFNKK